MKELMCLSAVAVAALAVAERRITVYAPTANLEEFKKVAQEAKELGANHVWATQIEPSLWIWDRDRYDPYPNWSFGHATIFKYVVREEIMENHRRDGFACVWRTRASCDSRVASPIRHCSRLRVFCRWNLLFGNRQADRA